MDLRLLFLIYFIVISSCLLFPILCILVEDKAERNILIKITIGLITLGSFGMIKTMYF